MATQKKSHAEKDEAQVDAKAGGAAAGGVAGAAIGAAVGGPVGAGIGAVAGAAAGGLTGAALDYNEYEPEFRKHYESGPYREISKWDDVAPAYRYGFENAGSEAYHGRSWDDARADLKRHWRHKGHFEDLEPMVKHGWERRSGTASAGATAGTASAAATTHRAAGETVVPVVEEEIKVGKRKVEKGGVRVETTVEEAPVHADVHLHEEHVKVERRKADRPATVADTAFKEGTIEMRETAEEVVVQKRPRVIEEVVISRTGHDRTERVKDKVRRTDVKVTETDTPERVVHTEWKDLEADFRKDATTRFAKAGYDYDQVNPAYRFGYELAHDEHHHTDWSSVEPEARRYWEERNEGTWDQFKDAVHHAWDRAVGKS